MTQARNADMDKEIKLSDLCYYVFKRIWMILGILFLSVALVLGYSLRSHEPAYMAKASMVVNTKYNQTYTANASGAPTSNEIHLAQDLVSTYTLILKSDRIMQYVVDALGLPVTASELRASVSLSSVKDTQVLYLTVTHRDPDLAVQIANTIIAYAPQIMMETVEIGSVNVLDSASAAVPVSVSLVKNTGIGVAAGLVLGVGIALGTGLLFPRIKNPDDIRTMLTIETLGEIMHLNVRRKGRLPLLCGPKPPRQMADAFMLLSSSVRYTAETQGMKRLLVTSALESEGKTFISLNLAAALAKSGKNVLLIDCDFRKQAVHRLLGLQRGCAGNLVSAAVSQSGGAALRDCMVQIIPGLSVIPFAELPIKHSAEFINSDAFKQALDRLSSAYDYVIIDSPPAYFMADTMDLIHLCDGVLFVVRQEHAPEKVLLETADKLMGNGAKIIGCVLNDIRHFHAGSGYAGKHKYYAYRYGHTDSAAPSVRKDERMAAP